MVWDIFTKEWLPRAERVERARADDAYRFIRLWTAFNGWMRGRYGEIHSDRALLDEVKHSDDICDVFLAMRITDTRFGNSLLKLGKYTVMDMRYPEDPSELLVYDGTFTSLMEVLYSVRCNPFHGRDDVSEDENDILLVSLAYRILLPLFQQFLTQHKATDHTELHWQGTALGHPQSVQSHNGIIGYLVATSLRRFRFQNGVRELFGSLRNLWSKNLAFVLGSLVGVVIVVAVPIILRNALCDSNSEHRAGVQFREVMNEVEESSLPVTGAMMAVQDADAERIVAARELRIAPQSMAVQDAAAEWATAARELRIALQSWKPELNRALSALRAVDTGDAEGAAILQSYEQCLHLWLEFVALYCKGIDDDGEVADVDALLEAQEKWLHAYRLHLQVLEALREQADNG